MTTPTTVVEAYIDGDWETITDAVRSVERVTIRRGRFNEGSADPGTLTLTLADDDGAFTEGNTASPFYPHWGRWTRLRVTVDSLVRFDGNITSLSTRWVDRLERARTTITAVDVMARLAAAPVVASSADAVIAGLNPVVWLSARGSRGAMRSRLDGRQLAHDASYGGSVAFGVDAPDGLRAGEQVRLTSTAGGTSPMQGGNFGLDAYSTTAWTILAVVTPEAWAAGTGSINSTAAVVVGGESYPGYDLGARVALLCTSSGALSRFVHPSLATVTGLADVPGEFTLNQPALVALSVSGTSVSLLGTPSTGTLSAAIPLSALFGGIQIRADDGGRALFSDVFVLDYAMTEGQYRATLGALLEDNDLAAPVSTILQPSLDAAGIDATVQVLGHDRFMLAPNFAQTPAALGEQLAQAAGALYVADRETGDPTWIDHRYVGPVVTIDGDTDGFDAERMTWAADRSLAVTDVTCDGELLASSGLTPKIGVDLPPLMPADERIHRANWLANTGAIMGAPRLSGMKLDLLTQTDAGVVADWLDIDLGYRLRIVNPPPQVPDPLRTYTIEGYEETVALDEWSLALVTAPDPRGIYGDAVQGIAGATADNRYGY